MDMYLSIKTSTWKPLIFGSRTECDHIVKNAEKVSLLSDNELENRSFCYTNSYNLCPGDNITYNSEEDPVFSGAEERKSRHLYAHTKKVSKIISRGAKQKLTKLSKSIKEKIRQNCFSNCFEHNSGLHKHYSYSLLNNTSDMGGYNLFNQFSSSLKTLGKKTTSGKHCESGRLYHGQTRASSSQFVNNDMLELHGAVNRRNINSKMYQVYKGQIQLTARVSGKNLSISVIEGKDLPVATDKGCTSFVKVYITGQTSTKKMQQSKRMFTTSKNPVYDETFTFQLKKKHFRQRVQVAVYHYNPIVDYAKIIGSMSFSVQNIADICGGGGGGGGIGGWYYVLADNLGEVKHMKVYKTKTSELLKQSTQGKFSQSKSGQHLCDYESDTSGYCGSQSDDLSDTEQREVKENDKRSRLTAELCRVPISKCSQSYGFSLVEGYPARISHIHPQSAAQEAGLCVGDYIIQINGQHVYGLKSSEVAGIIKHYPQWMVIDVLRADRSQDQHQGKTLTREKCWQFLNHVESDLNDSISDCSTLDE